ncbi:hypothetical protein R1sor_009781 [Riccia sorocarpa]|uniref:Uncharacterized protein n=1 Tax=Riccia sorocarpa TaxID=122646 RepID=A0ABD3I032_9MARC
MDPYSFSHVRSQSEGSSMTSSQGHIQHVLNIPPIPFRIPPQHFDEFVSVAVPDSQTSGKVVEEGSKDPSPAQVPVEVPKRRRRCVGGAEDLSSGPEEPQSADKRPTKRSLKTSTLQKGKKKIKREFPWSIPDTFNNSSLSLNSLSKGLAITVTPEVYHEEEKDRGFTILWPVILFGNQGTRYTLPP